MAKRQQLSDKFSVKKCSKRDCTAEDRISKLPDEILAHILSFLSVKEAADTSVLSKRWLPLWTYIYRLDFNATKPLTEVALNRKLRKRHMNKYIRWVNRTLQMCKVQRLDQFRVCFDLDNFAQHEIDRWLEFAVARKVQRLELDLSKAGELPQPFTDRYNFPAQHIGLNDYAAQPRLNYVHKLPPLLRNFMSLKVLLFKSVNVTGEVLEFFLYNCPSLEEMSVQQSVTLLNLEVVGPSLKLKHLRIFYCNKLESLKICDTNLVTLVTSSAHKLLLLNVPMLIKVGIKGRPPHILDEVLPTVSCVLSQLEVLTIYAAPEGLEYVGKYKIPQLTMLKKFVLDLAVWDDASFLDCTNVIEAAPQLTEFELNLLWCGPKRSKRECRKVVNCPLHHLKEVRLYGYYGRTSELELVMYFLENAIVLEKIIIDPKPYNFHIKWEPKESKRVRIAREYAKLQLESEVPSHIELVIL